MSLKKSIILNQRPERMAPLTGECLAMPLLGFVRRDGALVSPDWSGYDLHGVPSSVIYYQQVTVAWSGAPGSPDCTGTYTAAGMYNGVPYYRIGSGNWFFSNLTYFYGGSYYNQWVVSGVVGGSSPEWYKQTTSQFAGPVGGTYQPYGGSTGTATVSAVPASGIYSQTLVGLTAPVTGPNPGWRDNGATGFDGGSGYVDCGPCIVDPSGAFSVCFWANVTSPASTAIIFSNTLSTGSRFALLISSSRDLRASFYNGAFYSSSGPLPSGFVFVGITKEEGAVAPALSFNCALQVGNANATTSIVNRTVIGAQANLTLPATMQMANLHIWPRAVSADEIRNVYDQERMI